MAYETSILNQAPNGEAMKEAITPMAAALDQLGQDLEELNSVITMLDLKTKTIRVSRPKADTKTEDTDVRESHSYAVEYVARCSCLLRKARTALSNIVTELEC